MDVVAALAELVAFPTVSDRPVTAIAAWLAERAADAGMEVERFETAPGKANVVARVGPRGTGGGLTLSGHMDVVPVDGQDWTSDPFVLAERDGRLYGRGSADMKGFLAATCAALAGLDLSRLQHELALVWTHDEEVGCRGSHALAQALRDRPDPLPVATLIGEPTDFRICRAHPGHTTMAVRLRGRPAHSSRPDLGLSAIAAAGRALVALEGLQARLAATGHGADPLLLEALPAPYPVLNCGHVHGGSAVNIVPERCELRLGIRPLPGQRGADLVALVRATVEEACAGFTRAGGAVEATLLQEAPPLLTPAGTALEHLLAGLAADPRPTAVPFATDGGNLATLGTQPLVFGPGSIAVAHRADEHVPLDQLHRCVAITRRLALDRCGARPL